MLFNILKKPYQVEKVRKFIIIFYIIGIIGFLISFTHQLFLSIIPFALLLNIYLLFSFHPQHNKKTIIIFSTIFIIGYFIEVIGVNTGVFFGFYEYGNGLGFKILNTPLIIGLNWIFVTYLGMSLANYFKLSKLLKYLMAPVIMVIYDIFLEPIADNLNMWHWNNHQVPIQNYVAWFILGFIFTMLVQKSQINTNNPLSITLYLSQVLFFIILNIFS